MLSQNMTVREVIMGCAYRSGYHKQQSLANDIGLEPGTLSRKLTNPEKMNGYDIGAILRNVKMDDEDRLALLKAFERGYY